MSGMYNLNCNSFFKWILPAAVTAPALHPLHRHGLVNFHVPLGNRMNPSFHKSHFAFFLLHSSKREREVLPRWTTSVPLTCRSSLQRTLRAGATGFTAANTVASTHQSLLTATTKQRAKALKTPLNLSWHHLKTQVQEHDPEHTVTTRSSWNGWRIDHFGSITEMHMTRGPQDLPGIARIVRDVFLFSLL